ncbi:endonuclease III [Massilimicrobiota sp. An80]|uniref:endonuclease III n=1 Tax=Massilimicrobiota sp. An80 TaxID=1965658 RepID=UPI000B4348B1|nr:endonuclease III [Massilimicrobiota sp. An80]OUN36463.1 endonuclease III [Massilimicrobiota sp. An80]
MNKERVKHILDVFDEMYPDAKCELVHHNELELLIAVMLSAQTTDASVNKLTEQLFQKYQSVEDYAKAPLSQLENDLRTIGLYRNKAKNVKAMAQKLIDDFDGQVPCDHEALQTLPGVGRKTANVVISEGFKVPAIAVDTHVERISKRLGFAFKKDSVLVVEQKLQKAIPQERWIKTHHQMIFFGRYHCKSINPDCQHCSLIDICKEPKRKKYLNIEKD